MTDDIKPIAKTSEPSLATEKQVIPINSADEPKVEVAEPTPAEPVAVTAEPVVVTPTDVAQVAESDNAQLASQIEVLSGEIQALEAKLDKLTNSSSSVTTTTVEEPKSEPVAEAAEPEKKEEAPVAEKPSEMPKDLYTQSMNEANSPEIREQYAQTADHAESGTALSMIAEVVSTFGIIIFAALLLMPLWRSFVGDEVREAIATIGWFSAMGCLLVGLILMLFVKGRLVLKIILGFILLITVILYLGATQNSLIEFLQPALGTIFEFYR